MIKNPSQRAQRFVGRKGLISGHHCAGDCGRALATFGVTQQNAHVEDTAVGVISIGQEAINDVAAIADPDLEVREQAIENRILKLGHRGIIELLPSRFFKHLLVHLCHVLARTLAVFHLDAFVAVRRHPAREFQNVARNGFFTHVA